MVPYYHAFLERFPDPQALAAAPAADVLAAWSGLGYNRRALALQRAAAVVAEHGWPEDLTELPGVGAYTAAAVASFAWDAQAAAVDTNVRRVICRHDGAEHARARSPRARRSWCRRPGGAVQPGDDGARRHRLPPAPARVRACPVRRGCASEGREPAPPRRRSRGASASRTATAGRAGGSSPRWWRASRRRRWPRRAALAGRGRPAARRARGPRRRRRAAAAVGTVARCGTSRSPIREADLDEVLDRLLPIVPQGVHLHAPVDDRLELASTATRRRAPSWRRRRARRCWRRRDRGRRRPERAPAGRARAAAADRRAIVVRPEGAPAPRPGCSTSSSATPAARSAPARTRPP